jgi:uncharacterized protein
MRLELSSIRQPETVVDQTYGPDQFAAQDDYRVVEPAHLRAVVHKDQDRFRVVGRVTATLELACGRCLEPYRIPVDSSFDLRYLPPGAAVAEGEDEAEVAGDDLSTSFYQDDAIDLAQLLQEQFYLALPMKPLCGPDCKGLCPACGTNLNVETCDCETSWVDPRMDALKALIPNRKNDDA